ncbi:MAG: 1,6-anhydro-N-acetylmuramyl-L-alanine amidase AmpD [Gammaproteobacteria bacterium]|nr:1,6-anhydro-N-acetylmuramyl-L-alanine amidase AmpD [Gammaproteobacteria bacterium]
MSLQEMSPIDDDGWLRGAIRVNSPNHDERPAQTEPSLLVIHNISLPPGEYGGPWIDDLFCNRLNGAAHPYFSEIASLRVSSHLLIRRDGGICQYVSFDKRAWHAGESCFDGRSACNDFSIGIELEGCDDSLYEPKQYQALTGVTRHIQSRYSAITVERIVGHCDIAAQRKTDPGEAFDWAHFRSALEG